MCVSLNSLSFIILRKMCNDFFENGWFRKILILEHEEVDGNREIVVSCFFESEIGSLFDKTGLQLYSRGEAFSCKSLRERAREARARCWVRYALQNK